VQLGPDDLEAAVLGGALLGGGGGGTIAEGRRLGRVAFEVGRPTLIPVGALPPQALVATVSLVGAPAAPEACVEPRDLVRALDLLVARLEAPLAGLIGSENGGAATVNGWLQSAASGLPLVDAPADGRAHPTGDLGGLALEQVPGYVSLQAAAGGSRARGRAVELHVRAPLALANQIVRAAAVAAGGLLAVARNPVQAAYLETHAAVGALSQALALGRLLREALPRGPHAVAEAACRALGGTVVIEAPLSHLERRSEGGFDVGCARAGDVELSIWNEYLTLEREGTRLATFPDLIATLDAATGLPVTSAELELGRHVIVLTAPARALKLGAALRIPDHYAPLERAVGKAIRCFAFPPADAPPA